MTGDSRTLIVLDDGRFGRALVFECPEEIITCHDTDGVRRALNRLQSAVASGLYAAGFMSYELGYALEPALRPLMPPSLPLPLIWFGLFDHPRTLENAALADYLHGRITRGHRLSPARPQWSREDYAARFQRARNYIAAGDVYQVNLTFPLHFHLGGDPLSLWCALRARQPVAWGGYIGTKDFSLLSLSPELFFRERDGVLTARPMKGTAARGKEDDATIADRLCGDEKNRAENLMIVDLIRNDLARVTEPGSVRVPELFTVETYPRFFGMTSTVTGRRRANVSLAEMVKALFPCGSVTGAPKIRAQQIIRELEDAPRGIYTGSMGFIAPDGDIALNVAIRTAHVGPDGTGVMGIGSGVVWDSEGDAEYEECLLKAQFLAQESEPFRLIETLLWTPDDGFHLLPEHLERLERSARWFGFACGPEHVRLVLNNYAAALPLRPHRVRLLLNAAGAADVTASPLVVPSPDAVWRYALSSERVQSCDPFLRHKTTRRTLYDTEHARLSQETGCDEVLFLNERGELTEGSRTTVFIRRGGAFLTPPLACGVLDGVLRRSLLRDPATGLREKILYLNDLLSADEVLLGNSVRGLIRAFPLRCDNPHNAP